MDLIDLRGVAYVLVELVRARSAGRRCVHAPSALPPAPHAIAPFSQALFDRRRSYRKVLFGSADVVRSIGIELDARSASARTSRSDVGLFTAVDSPPPNGQQNEPGRAAHDQCVTREGHARARMVSCMYRANVRKASAASLSAVPPNSIVVQIILRRRPDGPQVVTSHAPLTAFSVGIDPLLLAHKLDPP